MWETVLATEQRYAAEAQQLSEQLRVDAVKYAPQLCASASAASTAAAQLALVREEVSFQGAATQGLSARTQPVFPAEEIRETLRRRRRADAVFAHRAGLRRVMRTPAMVEEAWQACDWETLQEVHKVVRVLRRLDKPGLADRVEAVLMKCVSQLCHHWSQGRCTAPASLLFLASLPAPLLLRSVESNNNKNNNKNNNNSDEEEDDGGDLAGSSVRIATSLWLTMLTRALHAFDRAGSEASVSDFLVTLNVCRDFVLEHVSPLSDTVDDPDRRVTSDTVAAVRCSVARLQTRVLRHVRSRLTRALSSRTAASLASLARASLASPFAPFLTPLLLRAGQEQLEELSQTARNRFVQSEERFPLCLSEKEVSALAVTCSVATLPTSLLRFPSLTFASDALVKAVSVTIAMRLPELRETCAQLLRDFATFVRQRQKEASLLAACEQQLVPPLLAKLKLDSLDGASRAVVTD